MQLEELVPSLELCKRLKELGFDPHKSQFYWVRYKESGWYSVEYWPYAFARDEHIDEVVAAPTASELLRWAPQSIYIRSNKCYLQVLKDGLYLDERYLVRYESRSGGSIAVLGSEWGGITSFVSSNEILVNALAKMLIWLAENGHVKFGEGE